MAKNDTDAGTVRRMISSDLEMVLSWRNHPEVRRWMYTQHEITPAEHQTWFERADVNPNKHLLIYELAKIPLGFVNFTQADDGEIADWGFYLSPSAPKGIGRNLGCASLQHAFNELQLHKVCGQAFKENGRSINLHVALGFLQEGVLRENHFDGIRYLDVVCFGLLRKEWLTNNLMSDTHEK